MNGLISGLVHTTLMLVNKEEDDEAEEEVAGDESLWCQAKAGQRLSCPKNMNILQEHTENMMEMPRNKIITITAGEFEVPWNTYGCGEISFSMMNTDGFWKRGLVVIGALVLPKVNW
uniref:Uncharacterized protein n=1 Tax=Daucus carota subsp. sativus TaxID=79200 RepID=A0A166FW98_DAUCS